MKRLLLILIFLGFGHITPAQVSVEMEMISMSSASKNEHWKQTDSGSLLRISRGRMNVYLSIESRSFLPTAGGYMRFTIPNGISGKVRFKRLNREMRGLGYELYSLPNVLEYQYSESLKSILNSNQIMLDGELLIFNSHQDTIAKYYYEHGLNHGLCTEGDPNDQASIFSKLNYNYGALHGKTINRYLATAHWEELIYNMGVLEKSTYYNPEDQLLLIEIPDQSYHQYFDNGKLFQSVVKSKDHYRLSEYDSNGALRVSGQFTALRNGDSINMWHWYTSKGKLEKSKEYILDEIASEEIEIWDELIHWAHVFKEPEISGGAENLAAFLSRHIDWKRKDKGVLKIRCMIFPNGKVEHVQLRGVEGNIDVENQNAVLEYIRSSREFRPAQWLGRRASTEVILTISVN